MARGEWSIQELSRATGSTSRTLRHYGQLGLLEPSRLGANGQRFYDQDALVRLQRILLLRRLGLGLAAIGDVLAGERDTADALRVHLDLLEQERAGLERRIASVRTTLDKTGRGEQLMTADVFDGFDHTAHEQEVVERWGRDAYERGDTWWRSLSDDEKRASGQEQTDIAVAYGVALREMYVDDPRFSRHYDRHGSGAATYVRDAMAAYADRELE